MAEAADRRGACPKCGQQFAPTVLMCPHDGTVLEHENATKSRVGQVLDGKYRLDAFLAEGGMGAVFRATHVMLEKTIAIKLINPGIVSSPETVRRFQREARAATALNHRNIVGVYDLGQTPDGTLYIAMEYIDGPSLKSAIQAGHGVPPARTVAILRQVASALAVAHRHNIIHRDLKPHNIMLAKADDGSEVVKLVDFGIAKTFDEATQLTGTGMLIGTPHYMAPEQAQGLPVDARSDVYALGVILYEMLVGQVPFNDTSAPALLIKHIREEPIAPSVKKAGIPPALEAIALRCLQKDPANRFQSATEFGVALEAATATIPDPANEQTIVASGPNLASALPTLPQQMLDTTAPMGAAPEAATVKMQQTAATAPMNRPAAAPTAPTMPMTAPPAAAAHTAPTVATPTVPVAPPPSFAPTVPMGAAAAPSAPAPAFTPPAEPAMVPPSTRATVSQAAPPPVLPAAPPASKGSPMALVAAAAVILLAGVGYLAWSKSSSSSPAATTTAADVPRTVPAMAPQQTPPAGGASSESAAAVATPPVAAAATTPAAGTPPSTAAAPPPPVAPTAEAPASRAAASAASKAGAPPPPSAARPATPAQEPVRTAAQPAAAAASQPAPAAPVMPENPAVFFGCSGPSEVCGPLRSAVDDALDKAGFRSVRSAERADIAVGAAVEGVQDRNSPSGMQTRTYSIEVSAEARRTDDAVRMPGATTVSFDPTFGRERAEEKARLVAGDVVERLRAYVKKVRGQ